MTAFAAILTAALGSGVATGAQLEVQLVEIRHTVGGCGPEADDCTYARLTYPQVAGIDPDAAAGINAAIEAIMAASLFEGEVHATAGGVGDELLAEYRAFRAEFPEMAMPWSLDRTASVVYQGASVLSVAIDEFVYLGGAHPNSARTYLVFALATGERLGLDDLLATGSMDALTRLGERAFRAVRGLAPDDPLDEAGFWFDDNAFELNDNWALTAEGLAFRFDPYEVTSYAGGPTDFVIPRDQLADLARPGSPLAIDGDVRP